MNAARILEAAGIDSEELRAALHPIAPEEMNVWPAARPVRMLWRSGVSGMTIWRLILVDRDVMSGDTRRLGRLVVHELVHARQFAQVGYLRFMTRYVVEYLAARLRGKGHHQAYLGIGAEVEAREVAARLA